MICDVDISPQQCVYKGIIPPWGTALHRQCVQSRDLRFLPSGGETARLCKWLRDGPLSRQPDGAQIPSLQKKRIELNQHPSLSCVSFVFESHSECSSRLDCCLKSLRLFGIKLCLSSISQLKLEDKSSSGVLKLNPHRASGVLCAMVCHSLIRGHDNFVYIKNLQVCAEVDHVQSY